ncbi:Thiol-disulfide isomerase or thioredoxin [Lutibacter agarilyticus]|uniref:Thiol-disulfide isomerase or thioredoxin n=1 Tax=Lutibacter agarilyticus TaxID=1109740 RepID=A0A238XNQ1_9FLAO|nr:TlpA disulfide reductase family protein [Lutibacter agarilyticus]SNR60302.1 Thiol-disulfide isomerase or thioredoxin [Lutibacter agarilyticus]
MKNYYLITFFIILFSCSNKEKEEEIVSSGVFYPKVESRSVITGKISNIKNFSNKSKTIRLIVDDITIDKQVKYITTINENGKFLFDIPLSHSTKSFLVYSDGRIAPYIFPNDTLMINCEIIKRESLIGIKATSYDEKHKKFQNNFKKHDNWFYTEVDKFKKNLEKEQSPNNLKIEFLDFEKLLHKKIDSRIKDKQSNKIIYDYLKYSATYSCYENIIKLGRKIEDQKEKKTFYSFLTDSITFNQNALITSEYMYFLNFYSNFVEPRSTISIISTGKSDEQIKKELIAQKIENKLKLRPGIWGDYSVASNIRNTVIEREEEFTASSIDYYLELVKKNIKDNYTRQLLLAMLKKEKLSIIERDNINIPSGSEFQNTSKDLTSNLYDEILQKNKGKVIYMDFWATWCNPCIKQFPYSKKLHSKFESKDVSFVFLCCKSKKEAAENIIKTYQLKGQQYILNQKQYEYFEKQFEIVGFPSYILIDKQGEVYSKNASRPQSENTSITIEKLLNKK